MLRGAQDGVIPSHFIDMPRKAGPVVGCADEASTLCSPRAARGKRGSAAKYVSGFALA
jgi:hypothetical protein